jgi:hypothetical protein
VHIQLRVGAFIAIMGTLVSITILVAGCSSSDPVATTIIGRVLHDSDHRALADVEVTDNNKVTTTVTDGTFALRLNDIGTVTIYVLGDGYEVAQREVPAGEGIKSAGTFYLKPVALPGFGHISGIVADAGAAAVGAQVWVGGNRAITDADGRYTLYNVPTGQQTVTASTGSKSGTTSAMVISLRTVTANIALSSGPPIGPF